MIAKQPDRPLRHAASFRDPSGFVYTGADGRLLRQVHRRYENDYRRLIDSSLYDALVEQQMLIDHQEVELSLRATDDAVLVLEPRRLRWISYPYEWSFSQLRQAALLTLRIQQQAMKVGMTLKDASSYNIQFDGFRPVFVDTLSFESYTAGHPWTAYGQFCRHFLVPLALMSKTDASLNRLLALYLDGIPLDLASKLLPWRTRWNPALAMHVHLHARMVHKHSDSAASSRKPRFGGMSSGGVERIVEHLINTVKKLKWNPAGTEWADYYTANSYSETGFEEKRQLVSAYLDDAAPTSVWDLGGNTGVFSRLASDRGIPTISFDIDPACIEKNYRQCRKEENEFLLPLWLDLGNPSPAIGWAHSERESLLDRGPCDLAMALAIVHHLAISNNTPLPHIAGFLRQACRHLIVEFVPKQDPQVQRLLATRTDVFCDYHQDGFEAAFRQHFDTLRRQSVGADGRVLYLMKAR